jgi:putative ABC transport system permease protein
VSALRGRFHLLVVVAVAVATLAIGMAVERGIRDRVAQLADLMGADLVFVLRLDEDGLGPADLERLRSLAVVREAEGHGGVLVLQAGKHAIGYFEVGTSYPAVLGLTYSTGGGFSADAGSEAILGFDVARTLFGDADPVGEKLAGLKIVGVLQEFAAEDTVRAALNGQVLVPMGFAPSAFSVSPFSSGRPYARLVARTTDDLDRAVTEIAKAFPDCRVVPVTTFAAMSTNVLRMATRAAQAASLGLSLLAAVGIAASLTLSVLRRTREIGIRRAVGAARWRITARFVGEAIAIAGTGAALGLAAAALVAPRLGARLEWEELQLLPYTLCLGAMAAVLPASAAARLRPVEALSRRTDVASGRCRPSGFGATAAAAVFVAACCAALGVAALTSVSRFTSSMWGGDAPRTLAVASGGPRSDSDLRPRTVLSAADAYALVGLSAVEGVAPASVKSAPVGSVKVAPSEMLVTWVGQGYSGLHVLHITAGRDLSEADLVERAEVCLLGNALAETLFGSSRKALGADVVCNDVSYRVVGVYTDSSHVEPFYGGPVIPAGSRGGLLSFLVRIRQGASIDDVAREIRGILDSAHPGTAGVEVYSVAVVADRTNARVLDIAARVLPSLAVGVALAAFITLQIVHFALRGRRQEIGVRRALGLRRLKATAAGVGEAVGMTWLGLSLGALTGGLLATPTLRWLQVEAPLEAAAVVWVFVAGLGLVATLGAWIAWRMTAASPADMLQEGGE